MAFPLSSVNMSPSAPSRRLSSFYYFLDLNMLFRIPFHFLWNLSQFHFCFKLTGNFLRCINYYLSSFLLTYSYFRHFTCSHVQWQALWAAALISFRYLNIFFFIRITCNHTVQSPFVIVSLSFCGIFILLIYRLLTILSLSFLKCGFLISSRFRLCVLLFFFSWLAHTAGLNNSFFSRVPDLFTSFISSSLLVGGRSSDWSPFKFRIDSNIWFPQNVLLDE